MVVKGQKRGRKGGGMGVCSQSNAVEVVSHDRGSLLDRKNCMLFLGFFFGACCCALCRLGSCNPKRHGHAYCI